MYLPSAPSKAVASHEEPQTVQQPLQIPSTKLRILLSEDNLINQVFSFLMSFCLFSKRLVCQVLKKRGHVIDVANDGLEAVTMFDRNGGHSVYDLLLMDEEMPKMKGAEVAQHIREMERGDKRLKRMPLVSISGHVSDEHVLKMKEVGVDQCLEKRMYF